MFTRADRIFSNRSDTLLIKRQTIAQMFKPWLKQYFFFLHTDNHCVYHVIDQDVSNIFWSSLQSQFVSLGGCLPSCSWYGNTNRASLFLWEDVCTVVHGTETQRGIYLDSNRASYHLISFYQTCTILVHFFSSSLVLWSDLRNFKRIHSMGSSSWPHIHAVLRPYLINTIRRMVIEGILYLCYQFYIY